MSNQRLREAAQQMLEAITEAHDESLDENHFECRQILMAQIKALRAALAQPETGAPCDHDKAQPVASSALGEVIGCFEAALSEGLQEALSETKDERLKDLVERRLMYALYAAQNAAQQPAAEQEPKRPENCGTSYCSCIECPYELGAELSNGDIDVIIHKCVGSPIGMHIWRSFARAVIAEDRAARGGAA